MAARKKIPIATKLVEAWKLSPAATFGSAVRAKGILLEVRAKLPPEMKKLLVLEGSVLELRVPEDSDADLRHVSAVIARTLEGIESLPVIPREVEDILAISTAARHRWLKDGRLQSAGTRTVKLHGRARKITFHVFDPRHIEDVLDRDLPTVWREVDALASAENRRMATGKAAAARARKKEAAAAAASKQGEAHASRLRDWDDFDIDGLLR